MFNQKNQKVEVQVNIGVDNSIPPLEELSFLPHIMLTDQVEDLLIKIEEPFHTFDGTNLPDLDKIAREFKKSLLDIKRVLDCEWFESTEEGYLLAKTSELGNLAVPISEDPIPPIESSIIRYKGKHYFDLEEGGFY